MTEKYVTMYIDDYPRRCSESKVDEVLEHIEKLKQQYLSKGVPQEILDKMYTVRIMKDENE